MRRQFLALAILAQYSAPSSGYTNPETGYSAGVYRDGTSWQAWSSETDTIYLDSLGHSCYTSRASGQSITTCD